MRSKQRPKYSGRFLKRYILDIGACACLESRNGNRRLGDCPNSVRKMSHLLTISAHQILQTPPLQVQQNNRVIDENACLRDVARSFRPAVLTCAVWEPRWLESKEIASVRQVSEDSRAKRAD